MAFPGGGALGGTPWPEFLVTEGDRAFGLKGRKKGNLGLKKRAEWVKGLQGGGFGIARFQTGLDHHFIPNILVPKFGPEWFFPFWGVITITWRLTKRGLGQVWKR